MTSTPDRISFAEIGATCIQDDVVLGTGTMISGVPVVDPATQARTTHFVEAFTPDDFNALSPIVDAPATFTLAIIPRLCQPQPQAHRPTV